MKDHINFLIKNLKKRIRTINKIKNINTNDINSTKVLNFIKIKPDYMIIISSNQILKKYLIYLKIKTLNFHGSKLPRYRAYFQYIEPILIKIKIFLLHFMRLMKRLMMAV